MSKAKFLFRCKNCSALFNKWQGKCEQCSSWDTIEKLDEKLSQNTATSISKADRLTAIADTEEKDIWQTGVYDNMISLTRNQKSINAPIGFRYYYVAMVFPFKKKKSFLK